jgi:DNA mismatch endonuclease (patch repair protein)
MADVVTPDVRSRMMSGIRGRNTKPELILRKGLHELGFRFRLNERDLPGKPDIVFPKYRAVLFAHGCFWHHHKCHLFKWPKSREQFWRSKIERNREVDIRTISQLTAAGWRCGIVWECALKGRTRLPQAIAIARCAKWLESNRRTFELTGRTE